MGLVSNIPAPFALLSNTSPAISTVDLYSLCQSLCHSPAVPALQGGLEMWESVPGPRPPDRHTQTSPTPSPLPAFNRLLHFSSVMCDTRGLKRACVMRFLRNKRKREFTFLPAVRWVKLRLTGTTQH